MYTFQHHTVLVSFLLLVIYKHLSIMFLLDVFTASGKRHSLIHCFALIQFNYKYFFSPISQKKLKKLKKKKKSWKNTKTQHQNNWVIASCPQGQKALTAERTKAWFGTGFGSGHSQSQWTFELESLWLRKGIAHCYFSYTVFLLLHIECQQNTAAGQSFSSFWQKWAQKGKWKQKEKLTHLITDYGRFNLRQPQSLLY